MRGQSFEPTNTRDEIKSKINAFLADPANGYGKDKQGTAHGLTPENPGSKMLERKTRP
jgi:hypothetical protein